MPDSEYLFPLGTTDQTVLNRSLNIASTALGLPHYKPYAMRAYYVRVRRSQGEDDAMIAGELGQTTNGQLIRDVYGDPQDLMGGKLFDWLPEDHAPAWDLLSIYNLEDSTAPGRSKLSRICHVQNTECHAPLPEDTAGGEVENEPESRQLPHENPQQ